MCYLYSTINDMEETTFKTQTPIHRIGELTRTLEEFGFIQLRVKSGDFWITCLFAHPEEGPGTQDLFDKLTEPFTKG